MFSSKTSQNTQLPPPSFQPFPLIGHQVCLGHSSQGVQGPFPKPGHVLLDLFHLWVGQKLPQKPVQTQKTQATIGKRSDLPKSCGPLDPGDMLFEPNIFHLDPLCWCNHETTGQISGPACIASVHSARCWSWPQRNPLVQNSHLNKTKDVKETQRHKELFCFKEIWWWESQVFCFMDPVVFPCPRVWWLCI